MNHIAAAGGRAGWCAVSIAPAERLGWLIIGLAATAAGAVLLVGAGTALAELLEALLAAAGRT
jgi:hypothetical protein